MTTIPDLEYIRRYTSAILEDIEKNEEKPYVSFLVEEALKLTRNAYSKQVSSRENPKYRHDCQFCTFLGRYEIEGQEYDLYFCPGKNRPTIIARYGNDAGSYLSGLVSIEMPPLNEAAKRAVKKGLLSPKQKTGSSDDKCVEDWIQYKKGE